MPSHALSPLAVWTHIEEEIGFPQCGSEACIKSEEPPKWKGKQVSNLLNYAHLLFALRIMSFATFSIIAALAATVSAHGYVNNASIGGVDYTVSLL